MSNNKTSCDQLAEVLAKDKAGRKLVDVKFYVGNPSGVAPERLCEDVLRVHTADGVVLRSPKI